MSHCPERPGGPPRCGDERKHTMPETPDETPDETSDRHTDGWAAWTPKPDEPVRPPQRTLDEIAADREDPPEE